MVDKVVEEKTGFSDEVVTTGGPTTGGCALTVGGTTIEDRIMRGSSHSINCSIYHICDTTLDLDSIKHMCYTSPIVQSSRHSR